jgi:hypothetical protein
MTTSAQIQFNPKLIYFPKEGEPSIVQNEWQIWNGEQDEGGISDL